VLFFNDPFKAILKPFTGSSAEVSTPVVEEVPANVSRAFGPMETTATPILLFGGETAVGECILQSMMKRGMFVRAVTPDVQKAQAAFEKMERNPESTLEFIKWTEDPKTKLPATESKPIIVCDSLSPYLKLLGMFKGEKDVYNPSRGVESMTWGPLDDVVMGGCSQSQLSIQQGKGDTAPYAAVFSGNITSANNGGFASVRTRNIEPALDLTGYDGLKIRLRGEGQRYKFMLRTTDNWDSVAYCKSFDTTEGWQDVELPFKDFFPVFRAKSVKPPPPLKLNNICSLQLMLSKFEYDGELNPSVKMGRFELPIESIKTYSDAGKMSRVVLVGGNEDDQKTLKAMTTEYTIIQPNLQEEVSMKDSTFVAFCIACLMEQAATNATFKEKTRSSFEGEITFDKLLESFSQE